MHTSSQDLQTLYDSFEYFIRYISGIQDAAREICDHLNYELNEHGDRIGEFYGPVDEIIHKHRCMESEFLSASDELKISLESALAAYKQFFSDIDKLVETKNEG